MSKKITVLRNKSLIWDWNYTLLLNFTHKLILSNSPDPLWLTRMGFSRLLQKKKVEASGICQAHAFLNKEGAESLGNFPQDTRQLLIEHTGTFQIGFQTFPLDLVLLTCLYLFLLLLTWAKDTTGTKLWWQFQNFLCSLKLQDISICQVWGNKVSFDKMP